MPDSLSQEMSNRIRAFCEEILNELNLPETTIIELENYFQDRMLGYLNGADPLSEKDAFLLTQRHFGDVQTIRDLFTEFHPQARHVIWYRWYLLSAALLLLAFFVSIPVNFIVISRSETLWNSNIFRYFEEMWDKLSSLTTPLFVLSLVILGFAMLSIHKVRIWPMDKIFGWYFLAFLIGNTITLFLFDNLTLVHWQAMPLNTFNTMLALLLLLVVSISFFKHAAWGKWVLIALLLLPLFEGLAWKQLEDEARSSFLSQKSQSWTRPGSEHNLDLSEPIIIEETKWIIRHVPPRGFSQALYALALLYIFLPRKSSRYDFCWDKHLPYTA